MPQAMKIRDAKAAVDKEWNKFETNPAWQLEKVESNGSTKRQKESPLRHTAGHVSPQKCRVGTQITEVQSTGEIL